MLSIPPGLLDDFDAENIPRYTIPEEVCGNLAFLTIMIQGSVLWNLGLQSNLRELGIYNSFDHLTPSTSLSYILEAILMRPGDFPLLEQITMTGNFLEWDLLILMLERKNIYAPSGVVRVKTIVLAEGPTYHLLYPITTLLQGMLPQRYANVMYSLEAIGERMWNGSS